MRVSVALDILYRGPPVPLPCLDADFGRGIL